MGQYTQSRSGVGNILAGLTVLDRGYTGHEYLQSVGLISMNARLYDPLLHRFLSADKLHTGSQQHAKLQSIWVCDE
jgi:RHS repeat-associated protein